MGKIKDFIKERIECLEAERQRLIGYLKNQLKLCPVKYHKKYRNSFDYIRADAGIKLCELEIEIWKALVGGK